MTDKEMAGRKVPQAASRRTVMCCPKCYNDHLLIRRKNGLERVMIFLTSKRKYVCMTCAHVFRAPDRRRVPRENDGVALNEAQRQVLRG